VHNLIYLVEKIRLSPSEKLYNAIFELNRVSIPTRYPDDLTKMKSEYKKNHGHALRLTGLFNLPIPLCFAFGIEVSQEYIGNYQEQQRGIEMVKKSTLKAVAFMKDRLQGLGNKGDWTINSVN
jgi:hypothetical protein